MGTVTEVSRDALFTRREAILTDLGIGYDELCQREAEGTLLGVESDALDDLRDIAFLLGE